MPPLPNRLLKRLGAPGASSSGPRWRSGSLKEGLKLILREERSLHGACSGDFRKVAEASVIGWYTRHLSRLPVLDWTDLGTTVARLESVLGCLERGVSSGDECTYPAGTQFLSRRFVRAAAERTSQLMKDAKSEQQDSVSFFGYFGAQGRGDHRLIDIYMVAVPTPDTASVSNPLELLFKRVSVLFLGSNIIKPKTDWPPRSVLLSKKSLPGS